MAVVAALMFVAVFAVREVVTAPGFAVTLLYYAPVALVAVAFGLRAGVAAATAAMLLFAVGDATEPIRSNGIALYTNAIGYVSRAVTFYILALLGLYSDRVHRLGEQFQALIDAAPDATVIVNDHGRVVLATAQAERLLSYTQGELLELRVEALIPERFRESHVDHRSGFFAAARSRPMGAGLELYALHKDGHEIPVEISLGPLETEDGTVVSAAIRDVTGRKRTELALRGAEERFRRAFDEAPIGMAMLDLEGRFMEVNDALSEITGYSREQLEASSLTAIAHPDDLGGQERELARMLAGAKTGARSDLRLVIRESILCGSRCGRPCCVMRIADRCGSSPRSRTSPIAVAKRSGCATSLTTTSSRDCSIAAASRPNSTPMPRAFSATAAQAPRSCSIWITSSSSTTRSGTARATRRSAWLPACCAHGCARATCSLG